MDKEGDNFFRMILDFTKKCGISFYLFVQSHLGFCQVVVSILVSLATFFMAFETYKLAIATRNQAEFTARATEYMMNNAGIFKLKITLGITIDSTKVHNVHPHLGMSSEKMPVFIGSEFKKYSQDFSFSVIVENKSSIPIREKFNIFLILKKFDDTDKEWRTIGQPFRLLAVSELKPGEKIERNKKINKAIHDSGLLSVEISDNSKVMLTLFAEFLNKEGYFNPKVEINPKLDFY